MSEMKIESAGEGQSESTPLFVVDTIGDPSLATKPTSKSKQPAVRSPSPTLSNSSDEVVLFKGRNNVNPSNNPLTRTKFKEKLTPASDGGYNAYTTKESSVRIETQEEQIAAVKTTSKIEETCIHQSAGQATQHLFAEPINGCPDAVQYAKSKHCRPQRRMSGPRARKAQPDLLMYMPELAALADIVVFADNAKAVTEWLSFACHTPAKR